MVDYDNTRLDSAPAPPVRRNSHLCLQRTRRSPGGTLLVDFERDIVGRHELRARSGLDCGGRGRNSPSSPASR
ncbi:hypothetical protein [Streptomyces sp. NPDC005374]|uniref:hypothetical protein n=1 Tax=Streptomyces sp. NPDC005374 TaxID=3364713 RepID=UPI00368184AE